MNWIFLATMPLLVPLMVSIPSSLRLDVWHIIAMSTPSRCPSLMNSGFPPRNSMEPLRRSESRYSISMYSSAGTAKSTTRPLNSGRTPGASRPAAAESSIPIWAWWPQACAAPVSGSAWGWSFTMRESSSPKRATVGPADSPLSSLRIPVRAIPLWAAIPISRSLVETSSEVLASRNPGSGLASIVWDTPTISSALESMAAQTLALSSSLDAMRTPISTLFRKP